MAAFISREVSELIDRAIVTRISGSPKGRQVWVDYLGEAVPCTVRGAAAGVVPGDEVRIERLADATYAVIGVLPRRGVVRLGERGAPVAANVEQVVVVREVRRSPVWRGDARSRSERGLGRTRTLVVLNKCDLADEAMLLSRAAPLVEEGAEVVLTSAVSGRGIAELRKKLEGRVSAFVGDAGAGKTTLLEALYPGYGIREAASELRPLPGGGYLAL